MTETSGVLAHMGADAQALVKRAWWVFVVGGLAMTVFGLLAFSNPGLALFVMATFFAASVLVDGVSNILGALQNRGKDGWWILLLLGLLGAVVGGYALTEDIGKRLGDDLRALLESDAELSAAYHNSVEQSEC